MNNITNKLNTLHNPSICIPRVHDFITKWEIMDTFNKLNIGKIHTIQEVYSTNINSKRVFIHFHYWNKHEKAVNLKNIINSGGSFNIVYQFPWFWKCYKSKPLKYVNNKKS